jgi:hypothetical protein
MALQTPGICCDHFDFLQMKIEFGPVEGPDDEAIEVLEWMEKMRGRKKVS